MDISKYFICLIILCCARECFQKKIYEVQTEEQNDYMKQLEIFGKDLAKVFGLKSYHPIDLETLAEMLSPFKMRSQRFFTGARNYLICSICQFAINNLISSLMAAETFATIICKIYLKMTSLSPGNLCVDIVEVNRPILEHILNNSLILSPSYACTVLLSNSHCYEPDVPQLSWTLEIDQEEKKHPRIRRVHTAKPLKVLHITDFHISPGYIVNSITQSCGYPVCCKTMGNEFHFAHAGKWGDYNCDVPVWMYDDVLKQIAHNHKDLAWIYFTGDIVDHILTDGDHHYNSKIISDTYLRMERHFPNKIVLPIIGNHESVPTNLYSPSGAPSHFSQSWLYNVMSGSSKHWLPSKALRSIKKQGYYAFLLHRHLKIIALNNNVCYKFNWWVLHDTTFLTEQLEFLRDELHDAEEFGHFVHILAHQPPGNEECIKPWEKNYNDLITRYAHIIKGQFFGHTHSDQLKIFYDRQNNPVNVGYNGNSLTPYANKNPNYKIIHVDPNTYEVLDIDTYIFNLTNANLNPDMSPRWYKLYSMKEAYGLDKLSATNFDALVLNMFTNDTLFHQYFRYYVSDGDPALKEGCDEHCKKELICEIITTSSLNPVYPEKCEED